MPAAVLVQQHAGNGRLSRLRRCLDDATGEHTSMFLVEEEGTLSSLRGIGQTIAAKGLFCSF